MIRENTLPMHNTIEELAFIILSIGPCIDTSAIFFSVSKFALVEAAISIGFDPIALRKPIPELALISNLAPIVDKSALAIEPGLIELPLIMRAIGIDIDPLPSSIPIDKPPSIVPSISKISHSLPMRVTFLEWALICGQSVLY